MKVMTTQEKIEDRKLNLEALLGNKAALRLYRKNTFKLQLLFGTVGVIVACLLISVPLYLITSNKDFLALLKIAMLWVGIPGIAGIIFSHYFIALEDEGSVFWGYLPFIIYAILRHLSEDTSVTIPFTIILSLWIISAFQRLIRDSVIEKIVAELKGLGVEVIFPDKEIKYTETQKDTDE